MGGMPEGMVITRISWAPGKIIWQLKIFNPREKRQKNDKTLRCSGSWPFVKQLRIVRLRKVWNVQDSLKSKASMIPEKKKKKGVLCEGLVIEKPIEAEMIRCFELASTSLVKVEQRSGSLRFLISFYVYILAVPDFLLHATISNNFVIKKNGKRNRLYFYT